ncbi:hypothetical protein JKP88DRAFT_334724 [Tribonema minus]|uniref:Calmodulin n=1 Tax=Tribonema minus TaxID=303371 RepID=A0A835YK05_9STRA|nr:hypothetical protein JKP88DRAFT_334724 [Tribonema minus]
MPLMDGELRTLVHHFEEKGGGAIDCEDVIACCAKGAAAAAAVGDGDGAAASKGLVGKLLSSSAQLLSRTASKGSNAAAPKGKKARGGGGGGSGDGEEGGDDKRGHHRHGRDGGSSGSGSDGGGSSGGGGAAKKRRAKSRDSGGDGNGGSDGTDAEDEEHDDNGRGNDEAHNSGGDGGTSAQKKKHGGGGGKADPLAAALRQRARAAAAAAAAGDDSADGATHVDWLALFADEDPEGTGAVSRGAAARVLESIGVRASDNELRALARRFRSKRSGGGGGSNGSGGGDGGGGIRYKRLAKWLAPRPGLDDATLQRIQRHLRGRLGRAFDLRAQFQEMAGGKGHLTAKTLEKGLRKAGLRVEREAAAAIVDAFDRDGDGRMEYMEFQRLVHARSLAELQSPVSPMSRARMDVLARSGRVQLNEDGESPAPDPSQARVDDEMYHKIVQALEKAFSFYDVDNSNSIDVREVESILRALGHDPTRKELRAVMRSADRDRNGVLQEMLICNKELRAVICRADRDRNGVLQFEEFQEAVMPYVLEKMSNVRLTEVEIRAMFEAIDTDHSSTITRDEFRFAFVEKLQVLNLEEADALVSLCDRDANGTISWEEFAELFKLVEDGDYAGGQLIKPELRDIVKAALLKLSMGSRPDPEEHLMAFMGMPSNFRKSVLCPLDNIPDFQLQSLLTPRLDSRGGLALPDMCVKVTTTVAEQDRTLQAPISDIVSGGGGPGGRERGGGSAGKARGRGGSVTSSVLLTPSKMGALITTLMSPMKTPPPMKGLGGTLSSAVRRRSSLLGAGEHVLERRVTKSATLRALGDIDSDDTMQVVLSVKSATGIPVPDDSRVKDVLQRSVRVCLFYQPPRELQDTADAPWRPEDHFFGNTYKTLAKQDKNREEVWNFPTSSGDADRKFLVRCDFDDPGDPRARDRVFVLIELTCTVRTGQAAPLEEDDSVRGPLTRFKAQKRTNAVTVDSDSDSDSPRSKNRKAARGGGSRRRSMVSTASDEDDDDGGGDDHGRKSPRRARGGDDSDDDSEGGGSGSSGASRNGSARKREGGNKKSRGGGSAKKNFNKNFNSSGGGRRQRAQSEDGQALENGRRRGRLSDGLGSPHGRRGGRRRAQSEGGGSERSLSDDDGGAGDDIPPGLVETEMSCGWALVPLAELAAETEAGRRVRYQLQGGTPFARADIQREEVQTRRYGWRALLKAARLDGVDKRSELELKVIPLRALPPDAQADALRLPRNVIVAASLAPLLRYHREALARALAARAGGGGAAFGRGGAVSAPALALFPRLAADPALAAALVALWAREEGRHGGGAEGGVKAFEACVLRAWPALVHVDAAPPPRLRAESFEALEARIKRARALALGGDSFQAGVPSQSHGGGGLGKEGGGGQLYAAFSAKEVAFDVA